MNNKTPKRKSERKMLIAMVAILALLLVAGIAAIAVLNGRQNDSQQPQESGQSTTPASQTQFQETTGGGESAPLTTPVPTTTAAQEQPQVTTTAPQTTPVPTTGLEVAPPPPATTPPAEEAFNPCKVKTPYATLEYPEKWREQLQVDITTTQNGVYTVAYTGRIDGKTAKLFAVVFGDYDMDLTGFMEGVGEDKIPVAIEYFTLEETVNWTDSQVQQAFQMQEAGEDLMEALKATKGFTAD